ncbi:MAG: hypothetical protein JOZ29_04270 [Deltaproteobacteria bacterium]|nr:hypothetical protein [Deltaproteobacteria bacterium]MBV8451472.1 hypothetical protein [Deltaproteobacteria bacterium]
MFDTLYGTSFLEYIDELLAAECNRAHGGLSRDPANAPSDQRFPKIGSANSEAHEAGDAGGRRQPFTHFLLVLSAAENNAAYFVSSAVMGELRRTMQALAGC